MVKFTKNAIKEINATLLSPTIPKGYALRVGIKGGACSSAYLLGFDKATKYDEELIIAGVKVIIDKRHLMYVIGVEIDYQQTEEGFGYTISK